MNEPKADPKLRPWRTAAYAMYILVSAAFSINLIVSVSHSVASMSPGRPDVVGAPLDSAACATEARRLWEALDAQRQALSRGKEVSKVDVGWTGFRTGWLKEVRAAEARCAIDSPGREKLKAVFAQLGHAMDLYTTHAVQYAGEVGPTVDALKGALEAAQPHP
jgi:hypothetical protein